MSYVQSYYHIVFSTKHRAPVLHKGQRETLFRYLWGILKNKHCHLYRINAVEDHLHPLTSIHPTLALADLIRELKTSTSAWIKKRMSFPNSPGGRQNMPLLPSRTPIAIPLLNTSRIRKPIISTKVFWMN